MGNEICWPDIVLYKCNDSVPSTSLTTTVVEKTKGVEIMITTMNDDDGNDEREYIGNIRQLFWLRICGLHACVETARTAKL